jgi:hypothetical protein
VEEDSPAIRFEAPEGAAEGFAGRVAGDVGEQSEVGGEALALEVFASDLVGCLGEVVGHQQILDQPADRNR